MYKLVLTTCPDLPTAHDIAERLVKADLAACVSFVPAIISIYKWQGELEQSQETQLFIKTVERNIAEIESTLSEHHPYDVPEFVVIDIDSGSDAYLSWISENTIKKSSNVND